MAPTRELAQQIEKEVKAFSRSSKGFKTAIVVGGANMGDQARARRLHAHPSLLQLQCLPLAAYGAYCRRRLRQQAPAAATEPATAAAAVRVG